MFPSPPLLPFHPLLPLLLHNVETTQQPQQIVRVSYRPLVCTMQALARLPDPHPSPLSRTYFLLPR